MKIIYHLSSRQKKELLIRGAPIEIALPAPPVEIDNPADWARSVLPSDVREYVVSATEEEVRVRPSRTHANPHLNPQGLSDFLGHIHDEDRAKSPAVWTVPIVAVVVRLRKGPARNEARNLQWPADVLVDGVSFVGPKKLD